MVEGTTFDKYIGAILGDYRLERFLEQNKWGPVFLTSSRTGNEPRVLRFLSAPAELTPEARIVFLGLFQQEANRIAALHHPHILPVLDYGNYQGMPYLVSPQLEVTSLRRLLSQKVPDDLRKVSRYLDQLAGALNYAHQHGVLHRSLASTCIFMQQHNHQLMIADFGIMRILELSRNGQAAPTGEAFEGSSESCAPEQVLGRRIDTYTDVYALGAVLYRLLTGHQPFTGKTRQEVAQQHVSAEVPPVTMWRKGLPERIDYILTKAMAKEPAQRFQRSAALADAFHDVVAPQDTSRVPLVSLSAPVAAVRPQSISITSQSRSVRVAPAYQQEAASRRRFLKLAAAGGGLVAAASIGGLTWYFTRPGSGHTSASANTNKLVATVTPAQQATATSAQHANVLARTTDVPLNSAQKFTIANQNNPGLLIHLPNDSFVAYDSTCTHAGCPVNYSSQDHLLLCPCHNAVFDPAKQAAVVSGPTQTPLTAVKIVVNSDGTISRA